MRAHPSCPLITVKSPSRKNENLEKARLANLHNGAIMLSKLLHLKLHHQPVDKGIGRVEVFAVLWAALTLLTRWVC